MTTLVEVLQGVVPDDHARQVTIAEMFLEEVDGLNGQINVLDLGCGDGRALDLFSSTNVPIVYFGIDIEDSPEVRSRVRSDATFQTFDGVNIPFADATFDYIYTCSVLEHVRHPDSLMAEASRVLKPGGVLIGSVSFLEPYHSYSVFNFTPYGVLRVMADAGLRVRWMRPGIDGITLTLRGVFGRKQFFDRWFVRPSPLNRFLDFRAWRRGLTPRDLNAQKLANCGHLVFAAERPGLISETESRSAS
jgi:SAM-dependent methyltransferase